MLHERNAPLVIHGNDTENELKYLEFQDNKFREKNQLLIWTVVLIGPEYTLG